MMAPETSALLGLVLLSIGVAAPPDQFAGGLFLAVALAFLAMSYSQPDDRKGYWLTLATAVLCAVAAAVAHDSLAPAWSLHLMMGGAGMFSRFLAEGAINFGRSLREQLGKIPAILRGKFLGKDEDDA